VQNIDVLNCNAVDFLIFIDYMIAPETFKPFMVHKDRNFIPELDILLVLKKINLWTDINQRLFTFIPGSLMHSYDYESVLKV
jgi:hypothetical protein